jgi:hypothetical protein
MFSGKRHDKQLVIAAKVSELQVAFVWSPRNQQHKLPTFSTIVLTVHKIMQNSFDM